MMLGKIFDGTAHVGSFEVREFRCRPFVERDGFYEEMDSHSHATFSVADAVCGGWSDPSQITDHGDIVELSKTWINPAIKNPNYLTLVIPTILRRLCPSASLAILKAFPLEYEGVVSDENRVAFQQRQRAMMRHYQKKLNFVPLPGTRGAEGWMYRLSLKVTDIVPPPDIV